MAGHWQRTRASYTSVAEKFIVLALLNIGPRTVIILNKKCLITLGHNFGKTTILTNMSWNPPEPPQGKKGLWPTR